jgi:hypothetical protein
MTLVSPHERVFVGFSTLHDLRSWIRKRIEYVELPLQRLANVALQNKIDALVIDPGLPTARRLDRATLKTLARRDLPGSPALH